MIKSAGNQSFTNMSHKVNRKIYFIAIPLILLGIYLLNNGDGGTSFVSAPGVEEKSTDTKVDDSAVDGSKENVQQEDAASTQKEVREPEETSLPRTAAVADVPFISQAPFGDWADPKQQHGCEEASLLMAHSWMQGEKLTKEIALTEIFAMSEFEEKNYGGVYDLSLEDTLKFWREYYGYKKSFTKYDISAADIKQEIAKGNPVVVPMDGTKLKNPQYTAPGPQRHEMVVIGYDDDTEEFITNDPGTRFGEGYKYDYEIFMDSIRDYKTGFDEPIDKAVKAMLVIEKE